MPYAKANEYIPNNQEAQYPIVKQEVSTVSVKEEELRRSHTTAKTLIISQNLQDGLAFQRTGPPFRKARPLYSSTIR
jgi:hypothetical protein